MPHSNVKMNCLCAPGFPVPEVSWFRDGQVISTSTLPGVQISFSDGRARLTIPAVTKANSGQYSLRATNGSGQATSTAELLVTGRLEGICLSSDPHTLEGISKTWGRGSTKSYEHSRCPLSLEEGPLEAKLIGRLFAFGI